MILPMALLGDEQARDLRRKLVIDGYLLNVDAFPQKDDKAVAHYTAEISDRQAYCEFSGIAPGTYAASAFHDENSNGKLDTNFMGIPREGVAASNDARGTAPGYMLS